jgi:hypothetical protein
VDLVTITIKVLEFTETPLGRVTNTAVLTSDVGSVKAVDVTDLHPIILTKDDNLDDVFIYLDEALAYARVCGDQIWVAAGTYSPDGYSDPNATFKLVNNVAVYGGFPSGGGGWQDRNWLDNETILSGDISSGIYSVVTA